MANKTMGELISNLRKEKGMTQKELAQQLNITDKAVSKWERNLAYPDTGSIPKLAEILGISVDQLMSGKVAASDGHCRTNDIMDLILKAIPTAMGVAVAITPLLGELDMKSGFSMLGIGMACIGTSLLKKK